jgi:hypothetical protein
MTEYERFGLVFTKTRVYINSGTVLYMSENDTGSLQCPLRWCWLAGDLTSRFCFLDEYG